MIYLLLFYLAKHNYEPGLNGQGRELVVRKDCYDQRAWNSSNVNAWETSSMLSWLSGNYKILFSSGVQGLMSTTTYRYTPGNGNQTVTTRSDAVFLLSATELGKSERWFNAEGSALPISGTLQVAHLNGNTHTQWTRSPVKGDTVHAIYLSAIGNVDLNYCSSTYASRPCFTLPSTAFVNQQLELVES